MLDHCATAARFRRQAGRAPATSLAAGEHLDFLSAGAYTSSYASVEFNGFASVQALCI
jgi:ornithine decarboxylase